MEVVKSIKIVAEEINKLNIIKGVYPRIQMFANTKLEVFIMDNTNGDIIIYQTDDGLTKNRC